MSDAESEPASLCIGTAGWAIPREHAATMPSEGSHLQRYAQVFACVEINSSFYRPHRPATYERWAAATPQNFRFAVKTPRDLTHEGALAPNRERLQAFLDEVRGLGAKLGPLLLQLPPKGSFDAARADAFLQLLRELHPTGSVVLEPRHASWFTPQAEELLRTHRIARVAADPQRVPEAMTPAGDPSIVYYRLHGSPRTYYSAYTDEFLSRMAAQMRGARQVQRQVWCIFDNTALGHATADALKLMERLSSVPA